MNPLSRSATAPLAAADDAAVAGPDPRYVAKATQAAVQFEGFFIAHMLHQMRAGTREMAGEDSVFKDPVNADMLDMADTMVADKMASQRAFGIADAILRQLLPPAPAAPQQPAASLPGAEKSAAGV
ncbi:rod-binding protein [Janthinobacterium fluminis]|uniref:Rod-binding protein n=1 Tax=Janthinobacterium fluminis TaxID=2987524 RepID=A0ABT5JWM6_9BURK|nr:rod-binding protein [Janthinobacterium fluminis]MDC8756476.1 rod-binding protein [Janthinobacterium fluminis]